VQDDVLLVLVIHLGHSPAPSPVVSHLSIRQHLTVEECEERFGLTNLYATRMIEIQGNDGRPPDWGLPEDAITVPTKMDISSCLRVG